MSWTLSAAETGIADAFTMRYFTAVGTVILLYDHILTISDEHRYLWKAPASPAKFAFLVNRYLVPCLLIGVVHEMCGFNGRPYSNTGCKRFFGAESLASSISILTANILVLMRVLVLWKGNSLMRVLLYGLCFASFCVFFSMMLLNVLRWLPGIEWSIYFNMCIVTNQSPFLTITWAAPIAFELIVIAAVVWNTIASPRSAKIPFSQALRKDGILFFLAVAMLQFCNLMFAAASRPTLSFVSLFFVWAAVTTILSRSLIRLRKVEIREHIGLHSARALSPFGFPGAPMDISYEGHMSDELEMSDISKHEAVIKVKRHIRGKSREM